MANIKISELSSVNHLDAQELNQVIGGWGYKYKYPYYYAPKYYKTSYYKSFNTATAINTSNINQGGKGNLNIAVVDQDAVAIAGSY